jgi:hypothetical protein
VEFVVLCAQLWARDEAGSERLAPHEDVVHPY